MRRTIDFFRKKKVQYFLKLLIIPICLIPFFSYVPVTRFLQVIKTIAFAPFFVAVMLGLLAIYVASIELWVFSRKQGILMSVFKLYLLNLGTRFYSFFSPVSSVGSILRWRRLSVNGRSAEGLMAIAANRVLDVIIAISIGLFWGVTAINDNAINIPIIFSSLLCSIFILWLLIEISSPVAIWAGRKSQNARGKLSVSGYFMLERLFRSINVYRNFSAREIIILSLTAVVGELITLLAYVFLAISVHIPISVADLGWIRSLLFLAALTPFTLIGGIGLREVSAILLISSLGVAADRAAVFSFLLYARGLVLSIIGGGVELIYFIFDREEISA